MRVNGAPPWRRAKKSPISAAMRIYKEFHFEAAHHLPSATPGHPNARMHGHSFRVRVSVDGEPDPRRGSSRTSRSWQARWRRWEELDHRLLNDIPGLEAPTLERIAGWLWNRLNKVPGLSPRSPSRATAARRAAS